MEHPSEEVLLRFVRGGATRPENRLVVRHLLARCPACAASLQHAPNGLPWGRPPTSPEDYDPAFEQAEAFVQTLTHKAAPSVAAGADRRPGSAATGKAARRRRPIG